MKKNDPPIVVEQTYNTTADKVWSAITELDQMRQWYFNNIPAFKAEVGFETQFNVHNEGRDFLHIWKVTEVEPLKKLTYTWRFEGYPGDSYVVFELSGKDNSVTLTVSPHITEDFPDDVPEFKRESCIGGWEYFVQKSLKAYLENQ